MISRDSIEAAYAFFHQKKRVYDHSTSATQRDDIEYAVSSYADGMSRSLYDVLARGRRQFLFDHTSFAADITEAVDALAALLQVGEEA